MDDGMNGYTFFSFAACCLSPSPYLLTNFLGGEKETLAWRETIDIWQLSCYKFFLAGLYRDSLEYRWFKLLCKRKEEEEEDILMSERSIFCSDSFVQGCTVHMPTWLVVHESVRFSQNVRRSPIPIPGRRQSRIFGTFETVVPKSDLGRNSHYIAQS